MVPAVPSFSVDQGFWYSNQDRAIGVGSLVRVPLGGRRVRGYVVEGGERPKGGPGLRPVGPLVMKLPVFDQALLSALEWAAHRYVAPISVLLERSTPPNLANRLRPAHPYQEKRDGDTPMSELARALAAGGRRPAIAYLTGAGNRGWVRDLAGPVLAAGKSLLLVVATTAEANLLAAQATADFSDQLALATSESSGAEATAAWLAAQSPPTLLIGTPRISAWPVAGLAAVVAVEEGRRAMKERQTPTISVRDFLRTRANVSRTGQVLIGPTPSLEAIAAGATVVRDRRRAWPPVEIVDRNREVSEGGFVGPNASSAIRAVLGRGGKVFVFAHRKGFSPASRCRTCATLRTCARCGAKTEPGNQCRRCGADLGPCSTCGGKEFVPLGAGVGRIAEELRRRLGSQPDLKVGSEADLAGLETQDLAVAVDCDGLILGTNYRAAEEALRIFARLAGKVGGKESRALFQTSQPDHPVIIALRAGDPIPFLQGEIAEREKLSLPPSSQLLVLETRGPVPDPGPLERAAAGISLLGPAARTLPSGESSQRWLAQARDLGQFRTRLRPVIQSWRDAGTVVRVDSDPIDL